MFWDMLGKSSQPSMINYCTSLEANQLVVRALPMQTLLINHSSLFC